MEEKKENLNQKETGVTRERCNSKQKWNHTFVLFNPDGTMSAVSFENAANARVECLREISEYRGRPLISYFANFLNIRPDIGALSSINMTDIEGITDLINGIPKEHKSIDVLIHSPGGDPNATERIVGILRNRFEEVHFLVPHSAYSAATMLALSGNSVTLHSSATLGPIDPQINGIPGKSMTKGFENIRDLVKREGPESLPAYIPLIEQYSIHLLEICKDSEELSKELVQEWIFKYMLNENEKFEGQAEAAAKFFSDYEKHKTHSRTISVDKIAHLELNIGFADDNLQELLWEAYITTNCLMEQIGILKYFDNSEGESFLRVPNHK